MRAGKLFIALLLISFFYQSQLVADAISTELSADSTANRLEFIQNKNQFHPNVNFLCQLGMLDRVYMEDDGFTYVFHDNTKLYEDSHDHAHDDEDGHGHDDGATTSHHEEITGIAAHAYKVNFVGADFSSLSGETQKSFHYNYFIGNDSDQWASNVPVYEGVKYTALYPGVDLKAYSVNGSFKYDFIVHPRANVENVKLEYTDVSDIFLKNDQLHIPVAGKTIIESKPYAYQIINGQKIEVPCNYKLDDQILSYDFPQGYNRTIELVIDPTVVASTLSGSPSFGGFGHTAAYDQEGNMYLGGISFGPDYPVTMGAFETTYGGGTSDISIAKFNPTGTDLIYATYLGSNNNDYPHSIIVDNNKQMCVLGTSNGSNYPVSENAVQSQSNGGFDIVITKLSIDGSKLIGSTYMGGSASDGQNQSFINTNYGENFRGEINVDQTGNIYIASCTSSQNFPTTSNAFQTSLNTNTNPTGPNVVQDGIVFKMSGDLSTLYWSTYLGATDADIVSSLRIGDDEEIYITGTAGSANFPTTAGTIQPDWPGGEESAFIAVLSANGRNLLRSTFWGSTGGDHSYFLDLDEDDNVHILGQSTGQMPITPNTYSANPLSSQFISGFTNDLTSLVYSTVIGVGGPSGSSASFGFAPVAFMVDKCNGIYFSGYHTRSGLPTTPDAIQQGSSTGSFYLGVLGPNAEELIYGTYFGRADHVDGGTSRFDKGGIVYQAVCSCVSGSAILNTNPDAYAANQTASCNAGIFKIDFDVESVTSAVALNQSATGCAPYTVEFGFSGQDGVSFLWDFDDDSTSTLRDPSHTFMEAGKYRVMMVAENLNSCNLKDTSYVSINVLGGPGSLDTFQLCEDSEFTFLDANIVEADYEWQDGSNTSTFQADSAGVYWVDISITGCLTRDSFIVIGQDNDFFSLGQDVVSCDTLDLDLGQFDLLNYQWSNGSTSSSIQVEETGDYSVTVTDRNRCIYIDTVLVTIGLQPIIEFNSDSVLCIGDTILLDPALTGASFVWQDGSTDSIYLVSEPGLYSLSANFNNCDAAAEILIEASELSLELGVDRVICDSTDYILTPDGLNPSTFIQSYNWSNGSSDSEILVDSGGDYWLELTDSFGCTTTDTIMLSFGGIPDPDLKDVDLCFTDSLFIDLESLGDNYEWQDGSTQSNFLIKEEGTYWVQTEKDGCQRVDSFDVQFYLIPQLGFTTKPLDCHDDCNGAIDLDPSASISEFSWSNGESNANIENLCAADYYLEYMDINGCSFLDTFKISEPEPLDFLFLNESFDCDGITIGTIEIDTVYGGVLPYEYSIAGSDPSTENNFANLSVGNYLVEVVDGNGCSLTTDIIIEPAESNLLSLGSDLSIDLGDEVLINGTLNEAENVTYNWLPPIGLSCDDCLTPLASPTVPTSYTLIASNSETGCILTDELFIDVIKQPTIFAPNIFTPDADNDNNRFTLFSEDGELSIESLLIYDRWGSLVFENRNFEPGALEQGWDGSFNGQSMGDGVYVYLAEVILASGERMQFKGDITLLR